MYIIDKILNLIQSINWIKARLFANFYKDETNWKGSMYYKSARTKIDNKIIRIKKEVEMLLNKDKNSFYLDCEQHPARIFMISKLKDMVHVLDFERNELESIESLEYKLNCEK